MAKRGNPTSFPGLGGGGGGDGGGFSGAAIWSVKLQDDVTAVSQKVANSVDELRQDVRQLGDAFKATNTGALNVTLGTAKKLFRESGQNITLFKAALKDAGVSALDSRLLIGRMNTELERTRRTALGMEGIFSRVFNPRTIWMASHALNVASKGLGAVRDVTSGALGVAGSIYDYGKQGVGSVIQAATSRQNAIAGMSYMLQKPGVSEDSANREAGELFRWAQKAAKETPLSTGQITGAFSQFMTAEFDPRQAKILTQVMADQASKFMDRPEMAHNVVGAFSRMKGRGVATGEDLESLRVAGFNAEKVMDALRELPELKSMFSGIKASDSPEMQAKKTKAVLGQGRVGWASMTQAAIDSLEKDRPDVGAMAKKLGGDSLAGTISNIEDAWTDLLQSVDLQKWPGVKAFQDFLQRIGRALDADTDSGKNLLGVVERSFNNLMEGLGTIEQSDIDGFVRRVGEAAEGLTKWLKEAWGWFDRLIHSDASFLDSVGDALIDVGIFIGQGLWKGATSMASTLTEERFAKRHGGLSKSYADYQAKLQGRPVEEVVAEFDAKRAAFDRGGGKVSVPWGGNATAATFEQVMAYKGPDFVDAATRMARSAEEMAEWGRPITGSFLDEVPKMASGGIVTRPTLALIGERGPEAVVPLGRGGGRGASASATVNITVQGAGDGADAAAQWEALRPTIQREIIATFERAAAEG